MSNVDEAPFQLFPALDAATEAALTASIERFGVLVPVVVDQNGQCLDGHHRRRIADALGVKYRVDVVQVAGDEEGREIARTLNSDRRHLDVEQRREIVAALREEGHSTTAIAAALGTSQSTVDRDLKDLTHAGKVSEPAQVMGQDGKRYPAKRPTVVAAKDTREAERAQQALATAPESMPGKVLDVKRAERIAREHEADERRAAAAGEPLEPVAAGDVELRHVDFRIGLQDLNGQVDAVITDPPYIKDAIDLIGALHDISRELLKPGGVLVAMLGQYHLPTYLLLIQSKDLPYRWTCAYMVPGQRNRNHGARVGTGWKPVIVCQKPGPEQPPFLLDDVFTSTGDDKAHHHWGQSESGMAQIVERFTQPGDLVVDPFLGGGTTGVVCRDLGRRFVGCDVDAAAFHAASERFQ